jgi:hypothetical protein
MNIGDEDEQYVIEPLEDPVRRQDPLPNESPATEPDEVEVSGRWL